MNTPRTITQYLIKEFSLNLLIFFSIFVSLILMINFIQELIFFKDQNYENNLYIFILKLSLINIPSHLIKISPFIFLFTCVFFYLKLLNNKEMNVIKLSGLSNLYLTLVPAIYSFCIGILIILIITPISSELSKYYEIIKNKYSDNENLVVMSNTGMWLKEQKNNEIYIIRTDRIENENFNKLKNITIYKFNQFNELQERIDSDDADIINSKIWNLKNIRITGTDLKKNIKNYKYVSDINLDNVKKIFNNPDTLSIWNILDELKKMRNIGYYGQDLIISFNKFLSLPFMLFAMSCFSTIFTLRSNFQFNYFIYTFLCVIIGIMLYFLNDISVAIARSGKIPLVLSIWMPVIIIMTISAYSLLRKE